jgi:hypothetical protein
MHPTALPAQAVPPDPQPADAPDAGDRLSAEVRESLLLLALSLLVTVGVAGAASLLLSLLA